MIDSESIERMKECECTIKKRAKRLIERAGMQALLGFPEICAKLRYSRSQVMRIEGKAIDRFSKSITFIENSHSCPKLR